MLRKAATPAPGADDPAPAAAAAWAIGLIIDDIDGSLLALPLTLVAAAEARPAKRDARKRKAATIANSFPSNVKNRPGESLGIGYFQ